MAAKRSTQTVLDRINDLQKQIDQMKEQIIYAHDVAQAARMRADNCSEKISKLEQEHGDHPTAPALPDSNGFWRDTFGDIWVYDGHVNNPPKFLFDTIHHAVRDQSKNVIATNWDRLDFYAPFTKIDSPFPTGEDHAN